MLLASRGNKQCYPLHCLISSFYTSSHNQLIKTFLILTTRGSCQQKLTRERRNKGQADNNLQTNTRAYTQLTEVLKDSGKITANNDHHIDKHQYRQCTYNVTLRRVLVTTVAVGKKQRVLNILSVSLLP